jgi:uncharacterized protein
VPFIVIRFPLIAAAAVALAPFALPVAAFAQTIPDQRMHSMTEVDSPLLSFSITEEIRSAPDRARVGAGIVTTAPTAVAAMRQNATQMAGVIAALRRAGIAERDIQTSGINLSAQYDYTPQQQGQPPRLIGYQVTNMVNVVTSDIARLGTLLDALVAAGGTSIDGPSFYMNDPDALLDTAREAALRRATERATRYARAAGYTRARLISVTEGGGFTPPPMPVMARMAADSAEPTPVQPGQVTNGITLSVQYRLER